MLRRDGIPGGWGKRRGDREYSDLGIVLRSYKLGESDKILRILTREHGKRSAVAKGVRKTTSRFGARLEPMTMARMLLYVGRSMDTVKQVEIETSFHEVREDLDLFLHASAMVELVDGITQEHEPHPELFDLLLGGLELLKGFPRRAPFIVYFFEFKVMAAAGFDLRVDSCANCGGEPGGGDVSFSLHLGGLVCDSCREGRYRETGRLITVRALSAELLSWMSLHGLGEWPEEPPGRATEREVGLLMDRVLEHWMEREFKSRRVMRETPGCRSERAKGG
ncbi:MAG: DNA repair protein RecO [Actinobacteria bacterium]|nr:DNA repair protein RecO [Actinomycetota bacterium]MCG2795290.1 DNA repair protein RecO [Actinomycetes bacterium]